MKSSIRTALVIAMPVLVTGPTFVAAFGTQVAQESPSKARHRWIGIRKKDGKVIDVTVEQSKIPKDVIVSLPPRQENHKLNKSQIRQLAEKHRLFARTEFNPHLRFKDGDISYWRDQNIAAWELELEFLARWLMLEVADREEVTIPTQGDLSHWATKLMGALYRATATERELAADQAKLGRELAKFVTLKTSKGKLAGVQVVSNKVPFDFLPDRDERRLNVSEIKELAKQHGLWSKWSVNPQLRFKDGDISYWHAQDAVYWEISLEFLARGAILHAAERDKAIVPTQGDLSHWATKVYASLYQETRKKWKADSP